MPLSTGQLLHHDRYRIVSLLGQGGMGAVYRAWDTTLNIPVAIKENLDASAEAQRQFGNEAGMLARLSHPNLTRVTDYFFLPGQGQYLVMDFIQGEDLQTKLDAASREQPSMSGLPESQVMPWIMQVCDALEYLHSQPAPVIHRDIKPANIKIRPDGRAVLVDFGIAKLYDPHLATTVGARAVTPGYSPPEQYGGGRTDTRTDVYALGATTYHLLTGTQPPESVYRMTGGAHMPEARQVNPAISPATSAAIQHALELISEQRFQSISEFHRALAASPPAPAFIPQPTVVAAPSSQTAAPAFPSAQAGTSAFPSSPAGQVPPVVAPKKRFPILVIPAALAVIVVLAVLLFNVLPLEPKATPPPATDFPALVAATSTLVDTLLPTILAPTQAPTQVPTAPPIATDSPTSLPPIEIPTTVPPLIAAGYTPVSRLKLPAGVDEFIRWVEVAPPYAYVLTREGSLYTYDLALLFKLEPPQEVYDQPVSQLQLESHNGLFLYSGWLYVFGHGLQALNLSNPASPAIDQAIPGAYLYTVAILQNHPTLSPSLAAGLDSGFTLASLSDPLAPVWQSTIWWGLYVYGIAFKDTWLYTSEFSIDSDQDNRLRGFTILDPVNPKEIFNSKTSQTAYHLKVSGDRLVACTSAEVELWSLDNPATPLLLVSNPASARVCALDGPNIVTAGDSFRIEGDTLVKLGSFDTGDGNTDGFPYGSAVTDNFVFLAFQNSVLILQKLY